MSIRVLVPVSISIFLALPAIAQVRAADTENYIRDCAEQKVTALMVSCETNTRSSVSVLDPRTNRMTSPEINFCKQQAVSDHAAMQRIVSDCQLEAFKWADRQSLETMGDVIPSNEGRVGGTVTPDDDEEVVISGIPESPRVPRRRPEAPVAPIPATRKPVVAAEPEPATTPVPTAVTGPTQAQVDAEVSQCLGLKQKATTCCGSPMSCSSELRASDQNKLQQLMNAKADSSGTSGSAAQLSKLKGMSRDVNTGFAGVCMAHQGVCTDTCLTAAQKYQQLAQSCGEGCANHELYAQAAQKLSSSSSSCTSLQAKATNLVQQSVADAADEEESDSIKSMASIELPADLEDKGTKAKVDPCSENPSSSACQTCTTNPGAPGCVNNSSFAQGQSGFIKPSKQKSLDDFNVPDAPVINDSYISSITPQAGQAAQYNVVPNNSGGAIPGGSSSGVGGAPAARKGSASFGSQGKITDIFPGGFVAGGYSVPAGSSTGRDIDGTRYRLNRGDGARDTRNSAPYFTGMDLKRFLPGGKLDPNRRLAGVRGPGSEINGKGTDVWNKITEKMNERCRLGLLWKCQP